MKIKSLSLPPCACGHFRWNIRTEVQGELSHDGLDIDSRVIFLNCSSCRRDAVLLEHDGGGALLVDKRTNGHIRWEELCEYVEILHEIFHKNALVLHRFRLDYERIRFASILIKHNIDPECSWDKIPKNKRKDIALESAETYISKYWEKPRGFEPVFLPNHPIPEFVLYYAKKDYLADNGRVIVKWAILSA